ncbi:MAG: tRNA dihydrouridine synthase DusB [Xanthobacteraceae bacterium]
MEYSSINVQPNEGRCYFQENGPRNLRVGPILLKNPVVLAPMSGITDAPFRRLAVKLGAGLVITEMTACAALVRGKPEAKLRLERQGTGIHAVQLAGCEAKWMAEGARIATDGGAELIDINMGCPARNVTNGQSGSALMRNLDHALTLIEATIAATKVPVTLKMRLGWDDGSRNAPELARRAEAAGVRMVTVHGRTRSQFFNGLANWEAVRAVKDSVAIPVVVNGDICSVEDAETALAQSGADAVMIGRGAQGRPWMPGLIGKYFNGGKADRDPPLAAQLAFLRELYEDILDHYGERLGLRHARKHLSWGLNVAASAAAVSAPVLGEIRTRVLTAEEPRRVMDHLAEAFDCLAMKAAA